MQLEKIDPIYMYLRTQQEAMTQDAYTFYILPMCMQALWHWFMTKVHYSSKLQHYI
jgi:hypothetical protein